MRWPRATQSLATLAAFVLVFASTGLAYADDPPSAGERQAKQKTTSAEAVDLAALALRPSDVADPGFGLTYGYNSTLEIDAQALNSLMGGTVADLPEIVEQLENAGWKQGYFGQVAIPSGDDPDLYGRKISNSMTLYEDEDGAGAGYDLLREANAASGFFKVRGGEPIGDESVLTRFAGKTSDGNDYLYLDVVFRVDSFVVELYISDYVGDQPEVQTISSYAELLLDRVSGVSSIKKPGLAPTALFLKGNGVSTDFSYYLRLNDDQVGYYGTSAADVRADDRYYGDFGITDIFVIGQTIRTSDEDETNYAGYFLNVYQLDSEEHAEELFGFWPGAWEENPAERFGDVEIVPGAENIGDEAALLTQSRERTDGSIAKGYRIYARVGDLVYVVTTESANGMPSSVTELIARATIKCAQKAGDCKSTSVPKGMN